MRIGENMKMKKWFPWTTGTLLAGAFLSGTSAMAADVQQAATTADQLSVYRSGRAGRGGGLCRRG